MAEKATSTVMVPLTVEDRAKRADDMASLVSRIAAIKAQAKAKAFEFKELVDGLMDELQEHARVLNAGLEDRDQLALTFPEEQAAKALHDIAKAACTCKDPSVHDPGCPTHGVDGSEAKAAASEREAKRTDEEQAAELARAGEIRGEDFVQVVAADAGQACEATAPLICATKDCGRPATCIGHYDGDPGGGEDTPACDECCLHGQEQGHCRPIEQAEEPETNGAEEPRDVPYAGIGGAVGADAAQPLEDIVAAASVDVGTVEGPASVAAFREKRAQAEGREVLDRDGQGPVVVTPEKTA